MYNKLPLGKRHKIENEFEEKFNFIPSADPKRWPSINEPKPSFTLSLTESVGDVWPTKQTVIDFFKRSFNRLEGQSKIHYILDWYHNCYLAPEIFENNLWVYPDGDYAICLSKDFSCGTFGHPGEQTICIFGDPLVRVTRRNLDESFSYILRENI